MNQNSVESRKTVSDIRLTFSRQFLSGVFQFSLLIFVAQVLGAEGTGAYSVSLLLPQILAQLLNLGITSANVYCIASKRFEAQHAWASSRDLIILVSAVGVLFGTGLIVLLGGKIFAGVPPALLFIALMNLPLLLVSNLALGLFQAKQDFRSLNLSILAQPIIALLTLVGIWFVVEINLFLVLISITFSQVVALAIALFFLGNHVRLFETAHDRLTYLRPALSFGVKSHLGNIITFLSYRLDVMLINFFAGNAAAGLYAVAVRLVEQLWIFSDAISTVAYPRLSAMATKDKNRDTFTAIMARIALWTTAIASVALAAIARPSISLLFGDEFQDAFLAFIILLPGVVLMSCARVLAHDLASRGYVGLNLLFAALALVVNIIGNLVAIPYFGIEGAAAATAFAYIVLFGAHLSVQFVQYGLSPTKLLSFRISELKYFILG